MQKTSDGLCKSGRTHRDGSWETKREVEDVRRNTGCKTAEDGDDTAHTQNTNTTHQIVYTKTVADSSLMAQRYNPEFTITTMSPTTTSYSNSNTSVLIDQLRHINQSQLASAPDSGTLLADAALDSSGSGDRPIWRKKGTGEDIDNDDEDVRGYDHDDEEASGSGMGPTTLDVIYPRKKRYLRVNNKLEALLRQVINETTPYDWKGFCKHVETLEREYWTKDGIIEDATEDLELEIQSNPLTKTSTILKNRENPTTGGASSILLSSIVMAVACVPLIA
ncbi:hypothetical protein WN48_04301 [Eufriesea mexicana]|uniref:Uncharacterized protein n=1 Tax=Eufriesea mexicana TaxID=516756 RepID=A0A310SLG2_9HYME|nr:hypothetical protein WN48_04301 [Eufriesea mexicana]